MSSTAPSHDSPIRPTLLDAAELGLRIRQARNATGMTQEKFAETAGLSGGYVSRLEQGRSIPTADVLRRIANASCRPVSYFFNGDASASPPRITILRRRGNGRQCAHSHERPAGLAPALGSAAPIWVAEPPSPAALAPGSAMAAQDGDMHGRLRLRTDSLAVGSVVAPERNGQVGLLVLMGRIEARIGRSSALLEARDAAFSSSSELRLSNPGPEPAEVLWICLAVEQAVARAALPRPVRKRMRNPACGV